MVSVEKFRDRNSEIGRQHGDTMVLTLRSIYGAGFAPDCQPTAMLSDVLHELDEPSLVRLIEDHEAQCLNDKLAARA